LGIFEDAQHAQLLTGTPLVIMRIQIDAFINETTRCFGAPPVSVILRQGGTEMDYDNTNRGALFRNEDKNPNDDKDRDYSGSLNIEGAEYWISGYVRTSKSGRKFLSLSVKSKNAKPKPAEPKPPLSADLNDEIGF
jgi:hypothetical protein